MIDARAQQTDNMFGDGYDVKRGLAAAKFAFCFYDLAPDEALSSRADSRRAATGASSCTRMRWWEALVRRSPGHEPQPHADAHQRRRPAAGRRRAPDPGVANWLDTEGRHEALLTLRWFWPQGDPPSPVARVVKLADIRAALPDDEPVVTPRARGTEIKARRDHLAWRFRT